MSKPLELTVYQIDRAEPSMVVVDGVWEYRPHDPAKRLTDAELAAEYQRGEFDYERAFHGMCYLSGNWKPDKFATYARREVLERFATLPHYDEKETP